MGMVHFVYFLGRFCCGKPLFVHLLELDQVVVVVLVLQSILDRPDAGVVLQKAEKNF